MSRAFGGDDRIRIRVSALGLVMLALISILASRLWFLQILAGDQYANAANANRVRLVTVPAPRGKILDRNGRTLVGTRSSLTVGIRRTDLHDRAGVVTRLSKILKMSVADIDKRLADKRVSPYKPVVIARDVPSETWLMLKERRDEYPGVELGVEPVRLYPGSGIACGAGVPGVSSDGRCSIAAHVIGYVGEISQSELDKLRDQGYRLGDEIGRAGIERTYEDVLRGRPGLEKLEVDSSGVVLRTLGTQAAVPGKDLQLSIDFTTQRVAEESLASGIERARNRTFAETKEYFNAPAGGVVVLDATNGEVVAMASYPTFDLRRFAGGIDPDYWKFLNDPENDQPLLNRALQAAYPPGSTFKPFLAAAAMQTGAANANTHLPCTTDFKIGDDPHVFHNWRSANSSLTLEGALIESCDTVFYRLGLNWWAKERAREKANQSIYETAQDWARRFGLGRPTHIDLANEAKGRIPGREFKRLQWRKYRERWCAKYRKATDAVTKKAYEDLCVRGYIWRGGDAVNMSIGQGDVQLSPLQLAIGYAGIANGGHVVVPHVGMKVLDPEIKQAIKLIDPKPSPVQGLTQPTVDYLRRSLASVTSRGTASAPFRGWPLDRIKVAAKTGSAEIVGKQPFSWFAAFAPADNPKYVVISVVEEAGFGSQVSGPIVRRIMDQLFDLPLTPIVYGSSRSD